MKNLFFILFVFGGVSCIFGMDTTRMQLLKKLGSENFFLIEELTGQVKNAEKDILGERTIEECCSLKKIDELAQQDFCEGTDSSKKINQATFKKVKTLFTLFGLCLKKKNTGILNEKKYPGVFAIVHGHAENIFLNIQESLVDSNVAHGFLEMVILHEIGHILYGHSRSQLTLWDFVHGSKATETDRDSEIPLRKHLFYIELIADIFAIAVARLAHAALYLAYNEQGSLVQQIKYVQEAFLYRDSLAQNRSPFSVNFNPMYNNKKRVLSFSDWFENENSKRCRLDLEQDCTFVSQKNHVLQSAKNYLENCISSLKTGAIERPMSMDDDVFDLSSKSVLGFEGNLDGYPCAVSLYETGYKAFCNRKDVKEKFCNNTSSITNYVYESTKELGLNEFFACIVDKK